ncbi:hypothetical protein [Streptomyces arboris]
MAGLIAGTGRRNGGNGAFGLAPGVNDWLSSVPAEEGALAKEDLGRSNDLAQDKLDKLFDAWGKENKVKSDLSEAAAGEAGQSYFNGRKAAYVALRADN